MDDSPADPDWLLLEDGPLLAVNKPVGLLTEGPSHIPTMVREIKQWLRERHDKPGNVYLGIPHRLDRETSGVLVFTRNSKTAARVAEQFEKRQVTKTYLALLDQRPESESGLLQDWLLKVPDQSRTEIVPAGTERAREARLEYRTLRAVGRHWLVEVNLLTGRMHQIRVQFASRGCPVAGDIKYGGQPWSPQPEADLTATAKTESASTDERHAAHSEESETRLGLHARRLKLLHPIRYDEITIEAPLPADWNISE